MPANSYFDQDQGIVFVQPDGPNTETRPLLCVDVDGIDRPQGDVTTRLCKTATGGWTVVNRSQGIPGEITLDIVSWKPQQRAWLQKQVERACPIPVYINHTDCGRVDVFTNYVAGELFANGYITSKASATTARGRVNAGDGAAEKTEDTYSLSFQPGSQQYWDLVGTVTDAQDEAEPLRDITTCTTPQCLGDCGTLTDPCAEIHVVADSSASPSTADGYESADYAATWTAWAAQPFLGGMDIASIVCIQIDRTTERIIVARGTTDAGPMDVAYSDDGGATWTEVTVGSTNTEYAMHSGALFALNQRNIWLCTDQGNVYFSSDGGLTWTLQSVPAPAANESLYYVHFVDESFGWAVGGFRTTPTGHFIQTTDGGAHWAMATTEPKVELGIWVSVIDNNRVWVGLDDGTVYYTNNWGTTWTARTLPVTPTNTGDGQFIDEYCGFICGHRTVSGNLFPIVYRTVNGGFDWEYWQHTTSFSTAVEQFGLNALLVCGYNVAHAVGEQLTGGFSIIWTLKPAGETW
jgi:hypothetical protein